MVYQDPNALVPHKIMCYGKPSVVRAISTPNESLTVALDDQAQATQAPIRFNYYVTETRSLHIATKSCLVTTAAENRVL